MAEPLSIDLRKRVVAAIKGGMSRRGAGRTFRSAFRAPSAGRRRLRKAATCRPSRKAATADRRRSKRKPTRSYRCWRRRRHHADGAASRSGRERASLQRLDDLAVLRPAEDHAQKRMARPVCKWFCRERRLVSLFIVSGLGGLPPGQDGDTRVPVLIKLAASSAVF